jgi:hypothetical protein
MRSPALETRKRALDVLGRPRQAGFSRARVDDSAQKSVLGGVTGQ